MSPFLLKPSISPGERRSLIRSATCESSWEYVEYYNLFMGKLTESPLLSIVILEAEFWGFIADIHHFSSPIHIKGLNVQYLRLQRNINEICRASKEGFLIIILGGATGELVVSPL